MDSKLYTVTDVAAIQHVSTDTVLAWIHSGDLPAENVATKTGPGTRPSYRIQPADLEAFRAKRRTVKLPKREKVRRVKVEHTYV